MPHLFRVFHPYYLTLSVLSYCIALKFFGAIQPCSVILSTSPCASSLFNKRSNNNNTIESISPHGKDGKDLPIQSQRWEQECNIPVRGVPDILENKRSIAATPPRIVTKVVRDKKLATTTNDDVTSPLSTASLATSPAIPRMEWAAR